MWCWTNLKWTQLQIWCIFYSFMRRFVNWHNFGYHIYLIDELLYIHEYNNSNINKLFVCVLILTPHRHRLGTFKATARAYAFCVSRYRLNITQLLLFVVISLVNLDVHLLLSFRWVTYTVALRSGYSMLFFVLKWTDFPNRRIIKMWAHRQKKLNLT